MVAAAVHAIVHTHRHTQTAPHTRTRTGTRTGTPTHTRTHTHTHAHAHARTQPHTQQPTSTATHTHRGDCVTSSWSLSIWYGAWGARRVEGINERGSREPWYLVLLWNREAHGQMEQTRLPTDTGLIPISPSLPDMAERRGSAGFTVKDWRGRQALLPDA